MRGTRGRLLKLALTASAIAGFVVATSAAPVSAADAGVNIVDNAFSPAPVHIDSGNMVTWTWVGNNMHSTSSDSSSSEVWDSTIHVKPHTYSHTFNSLGIFKYHCNVHS